MQAFSTYTLREPLRVQMLQLHSTTQQAGEESGGERVTV